MDPGLEGFADVVVVIKGCDGDNFGVGVGGKNLSGCLDTVQAGHVQVHEEDLGAGSCRKFYGFLSVGGCAYQVVEVSQVLFRLSRWENLEHAEEI